MGEERKRGKLADLNWLLRLPDPGSAGGRTVLARGRQRRCAGRHALCRHARHGHRVAARLGPSVRRRRWRTRSTGPDTTLPVSESCTGYGILQPRVSPSLPGTNRSLYARLHSGESGIDPYTRTVSDVYQDLFDEGSFIGKGIYDVDAFEHVLAGKLPENRILSHDLLEGSYARSGLLSDVELFEDYPSHLRGRRSATAPLGAWRLADRELGAAASAGRGRTAPPQSTRPPWPLEDHRQPAPQPRADRAAAAVAGRMDGTVVTARVDPRRAHRVRSRTRAEHRAAAGTEVARQRLADACSRSPAGCSDAMGAGGARTRVPAARGLLECRRDPAHDVASVRFATPAAAVESVRRAWAQRRSRRWSDRCG